MMVVIEGRFINLYFNSSSSDWWRHALTIHFSSLYLTYSIRQTIFTVLLDTTENCLGTIRFTRNSSRFNFATKEEDKKKTKKNSIIIYEMPSSSFLHSKSFFYFLKKYFTFFIFFLVISDNLSPSLWFFRYFCFNECVLYSSHTFFI